MKVRPESLGAPPRPLSDATARSPEQKVLDRLLGTWSHETTILKEDGTSEAKPRTSRYTCARVLGGQFVQEIHEDGENTHLMLYTYDLQRKSYRSWYFGAMGMAIECEGKWDAEARSLTWTAPPQQGRVLTIQYRFVTDDTIEQSNVAKDAAGKVVFRSQANHTRAKEAKGE
jgi:hypothetical protein